MMRKYVRKLSIWREGDVTTRINDLIQDPSRQLTVYGVSTLLDFIESVDYRLYELRYTVDKFSATINPLERLHVKKLSIEGITRKSIQPLIYNLKKVTDCTSLSLSFTANKLSQTIPFIPSVKQLSITNAPNLLQSIINYRSSLHCLTLINCDISDVSMLGSIPHLELIDCNQVENISFLNNNRHLVLERCERIRDYSHATASCEMIKIRTFDGRDRFFNLSLWGMVQDLTLTDSIRRQTWSHIKKFTLPATVKRCYLGGIFVSLVDFTVTTEHALTTITLSNDVTITSFEGYGLERVAIIECDEMRALQSLEGLGKGKNRKITITACNQITDFSSLNSLPIVEIKNCEGFRNPLELRFVPDLTIYPLRYFSFNAETIPHNVYESMYSLTLRGTEFITCFEGLEKIPYLYLDFHGSKLIKAFLKRGKRLLNKRIVLSEKMSYAIDHEELHKIHNLFLKEHYDYALSCTKWIWFEKRKQSVHL